MHKIRQLKYLSIANPATDPAGGPAGEPRLSIPELKLPQKLAASVRATQTSLHKMKLMQISKIFQNIFHLCVIDSFAHVMKTIEHYNDVIMGASNHQPHDCLLNRLFRRGSKKNQNSASLAFVQGIQRSPVNSRHKWPVTRKICPLDDVIMCVDTCILWAFSSDVFRWDVW